MRSGWRRIQPHIQMLDRPENEKISRQTHDGQFLFVENMAEP